VSRWSRWADPAVGVLAAALSIAIVLAGDHREGPVWANVAAFVLYGVLLALRSRAPVAAAFGFAGLLVLLSTVLTPPPHNVAIFFGLLLFAYTAGSSGRRVLTRFYMPVLLGCIAVANLSVENTNLGDWIFPSAITLAAYVAGRNAVYRSALAAELREATVRAEEAQAEEAHSAVAAERRRIAREMHDVVAHSISVMVVQAGGARRILERDPARAQQAAAQIERTGRETLTEMRRLLGVMHGGTEPAELEPNPTLADLEGLCRRRGASLRVTGEPRPIALGLEIGVYRVVQEALNDVRRTVPGSEAMVALDWSPDALELRVSDDRPYAGPELPAVRERVALYDGELRTGPREGGDGHQLVVRFPLHHADVVPQGA
jgi:signal transduction histidine kinase